MVKTIIYTTKYGTGKAYAERLGEALGCQVLALEQMPRDMADSLIFVAPIYMGQALGLKAFCSKMLPGQPFQVVLHGLFDYQNDGEKRAEIEKTLPDNCAAHYLPGAIQPDKLKLADRLIFKAVSKFLKSEHQQEIPRKPDLSNDRFEPLVQALSLD